MKLKKQWSRNICSSLLSRILIALDRVVDKYKKKDIIINVIA